METIDNLQKRTQAAGQRFLITEIEMVSSQLSRIALSPDPKTRARDLKEARTTIDLASRLAGSVQSLDPEAGEIQNRLQELRERLDQLAPRLPQSSAPKARAAISRRRNPAEPIRTTTT